jgi:hypothetical protein
MKVVDKGRMLLNDRAQGSSGLNKIHINKAEVEVREQSALDIVESVLLPSYVFLLCDLTFHLISFAIISLIRIKSLPRKWWMRGRCVSMVGLRAAVDWTTFTLRRRRWRYVSIFLGLC